MFLPRDCASPSRTFKGVQPHAATSLASRRLDLDLWTLRRDVFLAPPPCTRRKRSPYEFIVSFQFQAFSVSFGPFFEASALTFRPPPPGPANAWGSVVGAADRRDRPPLMYPGDEARSAPRRLSSPVEVGTLSHHLQGFQNIPGGWEWDFWTINNMIYDVVWILTTIFQDICLWIS